MAKYPYIVNKSGIWYKSGTEVPDTTNLTSKKEKAVETANTNPQEVSVIAEATNDNVQFTKTEINRMSTADLKKLAKENGLDESMSGAELKKAFIDKFEL